MEQISTVSTERVGMFPTLSWGAIFAGWAIALGIGVLLYLGGAALGLASVHAHSDGGTAKAIGIGVAIWTLLTWAGALFVGGMSASWFDGRNDTMMGAMYGLSVWGLTIAIAVVLLALSGHHMHRPSMRDSMHGAMMTGHGGLVAADMAILHGQLAREVRRGGGHDGGDGASPAPEQDGMGAPEEPAMPMRGGRGPRMRGNDGLGMVEMNLLHEDNATAKALLVADSGLADPEADRVLQSVAPQVDKTRADAKQAAAEAAHHAAAVAAVTFLAGLFSLLTALLGGWVGANHVHKVYHLRTYTRVDEPPLL